MRDRRLAMRTNQGHSATDAGTTIFPPVVSVYIWTALASLVSWTVVAPRLPEAIVHALTPPKERQTTWVWRVWYVVRPLVFFVPIAQLLVLLWVIWTRTAHVPYWDEWETVLLVQHLNQGTLTVHEIWALHASAHRQVIPRIVDLILIELTHWNRQVEMTFDVGVGLAAAALLLSSVRRTLGSVNATLALIVPLSLLLLSFSQFANWFAPFQITFIAAVFGVACCVKAFTTERLGWWWLGLAMLGALIASLSTLQGMLLWVAFIPSVTRAGYRKTLVWVASGTVAWLAYFWHFPGGAQRPHIQADLAFSLAYLGAPLGYPQVWLSQLFGALSILFLLGVVAIYWLRHRNVRIIVPWIGLALFVLGCAQATAFGRWDGGPQRALSSRYEACSSLWWVALLVIAGLLVKELVDTLRAQERGDTLATRWAQWGWATVGASIAALLLMCGGLALVNGVGLQYALIWQDAQRQHEQAIVDYQVAPDSCLTLYYPWPDRLRPRAAFLDQQHLAIFSDATARAQASAQGDAHLLPSCSKPYGSFIDDTGRMPVVLIQRGHASSLART